jgi:hypothetical protein
VNSIHIIKNEPGDPPTHPQDALNPNFMNWMGNDRDITTVLLIGGMGSGKSSVSFRVEGPNGEILWFETSLALLKSAVYGMLAMDGQI